MYRTVNKRRNQHNRLRWIGLTKTGEQLSVTVAQEDARQGSLNADLGIVPSPVMFGPGLAWVSTSLGLSQGF
jgi:glycine betaine/choline ABC-type transport system substrate-binding protein